MINDTLDKVGGDIIKLERLCYYNNDTGLPNLEKLKRDLVMYSDRDMALYILDLDNFGVINDILGKVKSDAFLKEISTKLREAEDKNLYIYHTDGDEFAFLEFNPQLNQIAKNAEFIINLFKQMAYSSHYQIGVSTSIGVAKYPDDVSLSGGLIDCASIALKAAKKEGKNTFQLFSRFLPTHDLDDYTFTEDIKRAFRNNEFVYHYQPIFNRDNEMVSIEALIRWHHPTEGLMYPKQFLNHIEQSGLIHEFSQLMFQLICQDYKVLTAHTTSVTISINISHRQLLNPLFISNALSIIRNEHIPADALSFEITEDILKYDVHGSMKKLDALKALGIAIELDDFGGQHSTLESLTELSLHKVKIDCSLIKNMTPHSKLEQLVKGIIQLCHSMNLIVIAECVETENLYQMLYQMGCDEFQGYYLHQATPIDDIFK